MVPLSIEGLVCINLHYVNFFRNYDSRSILKGPVPILNV